MKLDKLVSLQKSAKRFNNETTLLTRNTSPKAFPWHLQQLLLRSRNAKNPAQLQDTCHGEYHQEPPPQSRKSHRRISQLWGYPLGPLAPIAYIAGQQGQCHIRRLFTNAQREKFQSPGRQLNAHTSERLPSRKYFTPTHRCSATYHAAHEKKHVTR